MKPALLTFVLCLIFASQSLWAAGAPLGHMKSEAGPASAMHADMQQGDMHAGHAEHSDTHSHSCCDTQCPGCMAACIAIAGEVSPGASANPLPRSVDPSLGRPLARQPESLFRPPIAA